MSPWANLKLGIQYTAYTQFNGGNKNYDGFGRSASNNNTLYVFAWMGLRLPYSCGKPVQAEFGGLQGRSVRRPMRQMHTCTRYTAASWSKPACDFRWFDALLFSPVMSAVSDRPVTG